MEIFETHCHLNDEALYSQINEVINKAKEAGVTKMLVVGWDKTSSELAVQIANEYDCCYAAVGFHPENVFDISDDDLYETLELSKQPKVVAIGEIGLDYHWSKTEDRKEIQKEFFIKQIKYANEHGLPIVVHNRDAFGDCLKILKENKPQYSGVMHCYSGSVEILKDIYDLNMYIGLGGPVTFKNAETPKMVAQHVDLSRLLLETDCPYLAPHPLRGTVNEPVNIRLVLDEVAIQQNLSKKHIVEVTYENACKLFGIK